MSIPTIVTARASVREIGASRHRACIRTELAHPPTPPASCRVGLHPQERPAEPEDRPADVDRVHLFVLPRPDERVAKDLAHLGRDRHCGQPAGDRVLAVADGDDLLPLEREEEELEHFLTRAAGPP